MKRATRYPPPSPETIRAARLAVGLTQTQAGALLYRSLRCWQDWEYGHRSMDPQLWETWRIKAARVARLQFPVSSGEARTLETGG